MIYFFLTALVSVIVLTHFLRNNLWYLLLALAFLVSLNLLLRFFSPVLAGALVFSATFYFFCTLLFSKENRKPKNKTYKPDANIKEYRRINFGNGVVVKDMFEGIYVSGSAGSGKTRAVLIPILRHCATYNMGTLIYAYKGITEDKPELVEYALDIFGKEKCDIFAVTHPNKTVKINPLNRQYMGSELDIFNYFKEMVVSMTKGRNKADSKSEFFTNGAIGYLTALTMHLMDRAPQSCSLPHLVALGLSGNEEVLGNILRSTPRIQAQADVYLNSSGDQLSGMKGTIGNFLRTFADPKVAFAFHDPKGNYTSPKFNDPACPRNLIFVNDISKENVTLPILNSMMYLSMSLISQGKIHRSALVIDEASTINNDGFSRKPATLRSFECSTIYMVQDKSLVTETTSIDAYRAIMSNLASKFLGRVGDVETAKEYVKMFEQIRRSEYSHTSGKSSSTTVNKREKDKYTPNDFFRKNTGEFVFFAHGKDRKIFLPFKDGVGVTYAEDIRSVTTAELDQHYNEILEWGKNYFA